MDPAIARAAGGRLWFQAYVFKERAQTTRLIARAKAAGYEAALISRPALYGV